MRIAEGKSRKSVNWKAVDLTWDELCRRLSQTKRTNETNREYMSMKKEQQDEIKDVGGFVGGALDGGRRTRGGVISRSLITLDADFAPVNMVDTLSMLSEYEMVCYSTHKHTAAKPRLRFVLPMTREVTPEEYEPISRAIAAEMGIEAFDVTTHDVGRLFYWPSTPSDAPFVFERFEGKVVDPDEILGRYEDWRDAASWPVAESESEVRAKEGKLQGDPTTKAGAVGLFCRAYDVTEAIDAYLDGVYEMCDVASGYTRYTYVGGSTSGGAVLYDGDGGSFLFSHHATDPAGGVLCNAFDLVRLHKYGELDDGADLRGREVTKLASYKAMCDLVHSDTRCKVQMLEEMRGELVEDYGSDSCGAEVDGLMLEGVVGDVVLCSTAWVEELTIDPRTKGFECSIPNIVLVLENDPMVRGLIAYNEFTGRKVMMRDAPWRKLDAKERGAGSMWRDTDDAHVRAFFEKHYKMVSRDKIKDALHMVMAKNAYHPVRAYLDGLVWDGVERADTVLVRYLGAEDSDYVRTVTRTWLLAAVARVYQPGIKFDNVLMLIGPQGIGKSTLGSRLGGSWFSDSFSTVQGKEAFEQLRGGWIIEVAELAATRKSEAENVKHFISKSEDTYRPAFAENITSFPRQCVFYGTSNESDILRDSTGNRRFWTVSVNGCEAASGGNDTASGVAVFAALTSDVVAQVWAEVVGRWKSGDRSLHLPSAMSAELLERQEEFVERDVLQGAIEEYLDTLIPLDWEDKTMEERRAYYQGTDFGATKQGGGGCVERDIVCVREIAFELDLFKNGVPEQAQSRRISGVLRGISGWKNVGAKRRGPYGVQKCLKRVNAEKG